MTLVRSSIAYTGAQVGLLIVGIASSIAVSRELGPDGRGVFALVTVLVTSASTLATFGLGTSYTYLAGKRSHGGAQLAGSMIGLALALGLVTSGALYVASHVLLRSILRGMSREQFLITIASIPFVYLSFFFMNFLVGVGRIERVGWMQLGSGIVTAAVIIAAVVVVHQGVTAVVVIAALAAVGGAWWYTAVVIRDYGVTFRGSWPASSAALHYGARAYLGTLSSQLWLRADFFVLNGYAGPAAVGEYSLATSLAEQVWILDSSVSQVILHDVIGSPADEAGRLVAKTSRNVLFLTGAVCVSLAAVAPWLVPLVYGGAFRSAVTPLWLLLPGALGIAVARPVSSYFFGQLGKPQITSGVSIVTAVIGVGAYFALVPPFGASGAGAGSSIAYLVPLVAYIPLFGNLTGITARDMLLVSREDLAIYPHLLRSALGKVRLAGGVQPE